MQTNTAAIEFERFGKRSPVMQACAKFGTHLRHCTAAIEFERLHLLEQTLFSDVSMCQSLRIEVHLDTAAIEFERLHLVRQTLVSDASVCPV